MFTRLVRRVKSLEFRCLAPLYARVKVLLRMYYTC